MSPTSIEPITITITIRIGIGIEKSRDPRRGEMRPYAATKGNAGKAVPQKILQELRSSACDCGAATGRISSLIRQSPFENSLRLSYEG